MLTSLPADLSCPHELRETLQTLLTLAPTGMMLLRPEYAPHNPAWLIDLHYEYLNPAAQRLLDQPECPAATFLRDDPAAPPTGLWGFYHAAFQSGQVGQYCFHHQINDLTRLIQVVARRCGSRLVVNVSEAAGPGRGAAGPIRRTSRARVAERARIRQAIRAAADARRDELQQVFEQAPVAIAVFRGPQYVVELANPASCAYLDRTPAQLLGQPLYRVLPEAAGQGIEALLDSVLATGVPVVAHERPVFLDRHGRRDTVYWNFVYTPLRESDGRITGVTAVATDVSEQVAARQQLQILNDERATANAALREINAQLTRTNQDLDNFIYTASHDLKAPILNIEGLLHALREELPVAIQRAAPVQPLLALMQGAVERFQLTIAQLTTLARLQRAHFQPAETVNLTAVIEAVRLDLAPLLAAAAARLLVEVADNARIINAFSAKNLHLLIGNLLSNAVKYCSPDRPPLVRLRCYRVGAATVLDVQDNGLGLQPAQQAKIFGMFQRQHTHIEGAGIGLYTVKRLIEKAGGTLTVRSEIGIGSTFTTSLPD